MQQSSVDYVDMDRSRQSSGSMILESEASSRTQPGKNRGRNRRMSPSSGQTRARTQEADRECVSGGERNSDSYYSDDYENGSASGRSLSASSRSLSPVPRNRAHAKRISSSPIFKPGLQKVGSRNLRPRAPVQRGGVRSQSLSKDTSPKDLDLVTKRMLSARLLKINELKNELAETQLRLQKAQQENKVLRQLQVRQERALQRFEDTESEISQLLSQHSGEVHVLRERLRRSQERERTAEKSQREAQEELGRCRSALQKLRRLAEERHLGEREELARKLEQAEGRLADSDQRVKDLERSLELNSSSFQRQLTAERKKTHEVQEELKALREELERLNQKLKEKERELDTRNIYANRMVKGANRKDTENSLKKKGSSRSSTKGVQTEDGLLSLEFPAPLPAITEGHVRTRGDGYLSLKQEIPEGEWRPRALEDWHEAERQKEIEQQHRQDAEKATKLREDWKKEEADWKKLEEESRRRRGLNSSQMQEKNSEERKGQIHELLDREREQEERSRKEKLLAKMYEIDQHSHKADTGPFLSAVTEQKPVRSPPLGLSDSKNQSMSIFRFTDPGEELLEGGRELPRKADSSGKRAHWPVESADDLSFGSYAPSFGRPMARASLAGPRADGPEEVHRDGPGTATALAKERKPNLMEQLFGSNTNMPSKLEVLSGPTKDREVGHGVGKPSPMEANRKRDSLLALDSGHTSRSSRSAPHVAESLLAVKAVPSFDDDIEEVTL